MKVNKQLKFKSHERMQVEFISNNVDVMTRDCLSSVALALEKHVLLEKLRNDKCGRPCSPFTVKSCKRGWKCRWYFFGRINWTVGKPN